MVDLALSLLVQRLVCLVNGWDILNLPSMVRESWQLPPWLLQARRESTKRTVSIPRIQHHHRLED